jgi:hypothetical protein
MGTNGRHADLPAPQEAMRLLDQGTKKIGATGRFPLGKLTPADKGELRFAVAADPSTKLKSGHIW